MAGSCAHIPAIACMEYVEANISDPVLQTSGITFVMADCFFFITEVETKMLAAIVIASLLLLRASPSLAEVTSIRFKGMASFYPPFIFIFFPSQEPDIKD